MEKVCGMPSGRLSIRHLWRAQRVWCMNSICSRPGAMRAQGRYVPWYGKRMMARLIVQGMLRYGPLRFYVHKACWAVWPGCARSAGASVWGVHAH
jgi:hypothetical protein